MKSVIVLGAPRSGTSMTAGMLSLLGVWMGDVRKPDPLNPKGYFEDSDFLALADDIMRAADPRSNGFRPPAAEAIRRQKDLFNERIQKLVKAKMRDAHSPVWGWKATAISLCADFFLPHVPNPHIVVVRRNPESFARSAMQYVRHDVKRDLYQALSRADALDILRRYEESINRILSEFPTTPRMVLAHEDIVANPEVAATALAGFVGLSPGSARLRQAADSVSSGKSMRRYKWEAEMRRRLGHLRNRLQKKIVRFSA